MPIGCAHLVTPRRLALLGAVAGSLLSTPAHAQAEIPADPPPAGTPEVLPEIIEPGRPIGPADRDETPSEELSRTRGVIKPPEGTDPGLVHPPPDGGAAVIEVIPPPPVPELQPQ